MIISIHHASFLSSNLSQSRAFYEGILGLKPDTHRPKMNYEGIWYHLTATQQIHLLLLPNPENGLNRPPHGGHDRHLALRVSNLEELTDKLKNAGISYTLSASGRSALFCRDPDSNALEFILDQLN